MNTAPLSLINAEGLAEPLSDLAAWVNHFLCAEIPVLQSTAETLELLRVNEDLTDANSIGEVISGDPLMTLKVLVHASSVRGRRDIAPVETATAALVMIGISPFFRAFPPQPTVEERLALSASALDGLSKVLRRSHRSANFALAVAVHRTDPHAAAIHAAALLHEFTELLLWIHSPQLALRIEQEKSTDPTLRSHDAQLSVLGVGLSEVQHALASAWHLPTLLRHVADQQPAAAPADVRTVVLAANLARHTADHWNDAAIPSDINQLAALLNMSSTAAMELLQAVDAR